MGRVENVHQKEKVEVFHTSIAKIWVDGDGICRLKLTPRAHIGIEETRELFDIQNHVVGKAPIPVLFDMREIYSSTAEARIYAAQHAVDLQARAIAILDNSSIGAILAKIFMKLSKSYYPTKLFTSEDDAVD